MVEAAIADVIGPAVAADDPDAAADQVIDDRKQVLRHRIAAEAVQPFDQRRHAGVLGADFRLLQLRRGQDGLHQIGPEFRREGVCQRGCQRQMFVGREAEAEAELGIILE